MPAGEHGEHGQPPAGGRMFLAVDPGISADCVTVVSVDEHGTMWQELGWADVDGLVNHHADGRPVRPFHQGGMVQSGTLNSPPPHLETGSVFTPAQAREFGAEPEEPADILDRIDSVVNAATETVAAAPVSLCACGCRLAVGPDSPSPDFASATCQRLWHSRQATDAGDVYRRRDAARVVVGVDGARIPLQEADGNPADDDGGGVTRTPRWQRLNTAAADTAHQAAYRRLCNHCQELIIPDVYEDVEEALRAFASPARVRLVPARVRLECPLCATTITGSAYHGTVTENAQGMVLELTDTQSRVRRVLPPALLARAANPDGLIRSTWAELERLLSKFARRFNGQTGRQP